MVVKCPDCKGLTLYKLDDKFNYCTICGRRKIIIHDDVRDQDSVKI